jgi:CheY-like chemotaxis protein
MLDWNDPSSLRVLLVDDEVDNLEVVAESLEFYGVNVTTAGNGQDALKHLAADEMLPSLVLLDLSMPIMDGWETLRTIRADARLRSLPLIALSAHAIVGDVERAIAAGFDGYLTKPVRVPTLLEDIQAALKETIA